MSRSPHGSRFPLIAAASGALLLLGAVPASPASAQSVPSKTVPEPMTEPLPLPTSNPGLAGLTFSRDDALRDPFVNPALGALGPTLQLSVAPQFYEDHHGTLQGHSIPVGATWNVDGWFGGIAAGFKDAEDRPNRFRDLPWQIRDAALDDPGKNHYLAGSLGRVLFGRLALGVSVMDAEMEVVDGVRRSYPEALAVHQQGSQRTLLFGTILDAGEGRLFDLAVGQTDVEMTHEVHGWEMVPGGGGVDGLRPEDRWYTYLDRARIDHARVRYRHYVPSLLMRFGVMGAVHSREQFETPAFDLVNVPRDPGSSTFYEIGLGFEASDGGVGDFFGEFVYSPGRARTTTLADSPANGGDGSLIETGESLVDHALRFSNWRLDGGAEFNHGRTTGQIGIGVREHRFTIEQTDHRTGTSFDGGESWKEWSARAALEVDLGRVSLGYNAQVQARGFSPCPAHSFRRTCYGRTETFPSTGEVVAPTSPETLPDFQVFSHGPVLRVSLGG